MFYVSTDVGGTFTDSVVMDETGMLTLGKAQSTPPDFSTGVINAVADAASKIGLSEDEFWKQCALKVHGSTVATNDLLTRTGARAGLLMTRGFEDTLLIMRCMGRHAGLSESETKHIAWGKKPEPVIPRRLIKGVTERIDRKGKIVVALDKSDVRRAVEELIQEGVEAIAISYLWSFANSAHEQETRRFIEKEYPKLFVTASSDLVPLLGEYERTATTAFNAYLGPKVSRYLDTLDKTIKKKGYKRPLYIMQCHAGILTAREAGRSAVSMLNSGPVGGLAGGKYIADLIGLDNVICTDVGGTSFDVSLIYGGTVERAGDLAIGQYNIKIPMMDIQCIGVGGGSIAWVEADTNRLKVGPSSAGAKPGPVCYDTGGTEPTTTDADLILGYLNPDYFLCGKMKLKVAKAYEAIENKIARPLGMSVQDAAIGIRRIADEHMLDLVRSVSVGRGYDPRKCHILAFGGAGPLHAVSYGRGARAIVVPSTASVHSAFGVLSSNVKHVYERSELMDVPGDPIRFTENLRELGNRARTKLREEGFKDEEILLGFNLAMRYRRQLNEIDTPLPVKEQYDESDMIAASDAFERLYEKAYGKGAGHKEAGMEIVTFGATVEGLIHKPRLATFEKGQSSPPSAAMKTPRMAYSLELGKFTTFSIYELERLQPGNVIVGPAIIESPITTILIDAGYQASPDEYMNIIIKAGEL